MQHSFVEFIPDQLQEGILYISMEYCTAIHLCVCGCRNKVVTPFSPTDWKMTFDGKGISLYPSIGNWSFECKSHYWIKKSKVEWSGSWSDDQISNGRQADKVAKEKYYTPEPEKKTPIDAKKKKSLWEWIWEVLKF
ncbi:DUF6527 family protein [Algoriphagus sp. Y33]|uniref:DUF6527 family protein n=1 Tax=Algoriphagus sp. Y33 TaxID=2772483 RepID=UPI001CE0513E|nr:DUF6527 family protein [Algoriphagus sp. Y33]